jgi:hypothetical protein
MRQRVVLSVAVGALVIYVVLVVLMWAEVADGETTWARRLMLFNGLEAVALAGVGWLFGREVNRGAAVSAAEANTRAAAAEAERGRVTGKAESLAAAVRAASDNGGMESAPGGAGGALRALADELFPPRPARDPVR